MPKLIDIPGVGEIEFPDDMPDDAIAAAAARLTKEATPASSWSELPGNVLPSVGRLIGSAASGVGDVLQMMDPRPTSAGTQKRNALTQAVLSPVETGKAIGGVYSDRYGSPAQAKETLITDPAGVAADASVLLGGAGAGLRAAGTAAKVPGLVRAGQMAGTAGQAVDPLRGVANAVTGAGSLVRPSTATLQDWGTKWMQSAMKVAKPVQDSNTFNVARVAARDKIMPTAEGFQQAAKTAGDLKQDVIRLNRIAAQRGRRVDPRRIVGQLDRAADAVPANEAIPGPRQGALRDIRDEFWQAHSTPVETPVPREVDTGILDPAGQKILRTETVMQDTGQRTPAPITPRRSMRFTEQLNKRQNFAKRNPMAMSRSESPHIEAEDALRQAIRAERERVVPGTNALNERRGEQLAVMKQLQNYTLRREGNMDPIPARALLGGGLAAGLAAGGAPVGAVAGGTIVPWVVNSPAFKGKQAIRLFHGDTLLNRAGGAMRTGATATTQAGVASDALREALMRQLEAGSEIP